MREERLTTIPIDLEDCYEQFMRKVFPRVVEHSRQYFDCRRVFFVGVATIFDHVTLNVTDAQEDVALAELTNISKQLETFAEHLKKGNV